MNNLWLWRKRVCQLILSYRFLPRQKEKGRKKFKKEKKIKTAEHFRSFLLPSRLGFHIRKVIKADFWATVVLSESLCRFLPQKATCLFPPADLVCVSACILQWLLVSATKCLTEQYLCGIKAHALMNTHCKNNKERLTLGTVWQWRQRLVYKYIWSHRFIVMLNITRTHTNKNDDKPHKHKSFIS